MKLTRRQFLRGLALLPWVALPSLAKAQEPVEHIYLPLLNGLSKSGNPMVKCTGDSFTGTPLLDIFNRPDESPMTGWADTSGQSAIIGNLAAAEAVAGNFTSYYIGSTPFIGNYVDAYVQIVTRPSDGETVGVLQIVFGSGALLMGFTRDDGGGDYISILGGGGPYPKEMLDGDWLGMRFFQAGLIEIYHRTAVGLWTFVANWSKGAVTHNTSIGIFATDTTARLGNFGGGSCDSDPWVATAMPMTTKCAEDPSLALVCANGDRLDLITWESGFELDDPGWRPQMAQFKGGGSYANSQIAEGQTLVTGEYDNVVETIPLVARGTSEAACIKTYRRLQQFIKRASDYWKEPSEYDDVWLEVRPAGLGCRIGYARVVKASCVDFANPFGQPFFSQQSLSVADGLSLVVEREPLWRAVPPGEMIGPLYNLLKNPDFEEWNSGVADSQPDCWSDVEIGGITGTNGRDSTGPKWGRADLTVVVTNSTGAGQAKGVTQVAEGTEDGQEYTLVAWVRNAGVTGGVGRILVTSLLGQYEVYRSATQHGWTLYTYVLTAGVGDVIGVNCEILSTAAGTDGTCYFDSLMLLKGDWEQEAVDGMLPYMTSSHIFNHWDTGAGHLNYVDAWEVPGDGDALVRLEVVNDTTPADYTNVVEKIAHLYVGQRRTGDVQNFQNDHDPAGGADAACSNSDRLSLTPTSAWTDVTTHAVVGEGDVSDNVGRFRILARLYDAKGSGDPTLEARLAYWIGQAGAGEKFLTGVSMSQRAAWNMVNLTPNAAQIADAKFRSNFPGALSYTVQLRRPTGTGDARLDFVLQLPTDGGFLEAEVSPGLEKGVALVVDNTASNSIAAQGIRVGYNYKVALSTYIIRTFAEFKGDLYAGTSFSGAPHLHGGIWRARGGWLNVFDTETGSIKDLEIYNGKLYALHDTALVEILSSSDGVTWGRETATPVISGWSLKTFAGKLWIGLDSGVQGTVYSWDGSTLTLEYTVPAASSSTYALEEYNGKLYLGMGDGSIYVYTPGVGWALDFTSGENSVYCLEEFQGKLYAGTGDNGKIFAYDGSAWNLAYTPSLGASTQVRGMTVKDNVLIIAPSDSGVFKAALIRTADGITWETIYDPGTLESIWSIAIYEGDTYLGVLPQPITSGQIWTIVLDKSYEYSVANYQMGGGQNGGFTAPNRRLLDDERRHRWVISADRVDGSNAISDEMLIGLGYVSRFLSLIGEG